MSFTTEYVQTQIDRTFHVHRKNCKIFTTDFEMHHDVVIVDFLLSTINNSIIIIVIILFLFFITRDIRSIGILCVA